LIVQEFIPNVPTATLEKDGASKRGQAELHQFIFGAGGASQVEETVMD
jgi:hypothetical protein